ncbi:hypothetical protein NADFUDRAFT_50988 [Nadsonia fulvescens var. elongata DSM 6958]|uniref:Uncharacterized protein n=1 Tax=Nadsonia fulvescens var. elongata DSM 6958 TaxID=857566 RepID=A0A1E3PJU3_9ASCO|nr:hypothetical protein NADFUDRAFT_50988 [Nadsonia fulvescens var. elongata DSM 6958]
MTTVNDRIQTRVNNCKSSSSSPRLLRSSICHCPSRQLLLQLPLQSRQLSPIQSLSNIPPIGAKKEPQSSASTISRANNIVLGSIMASFIAYTAVRDALYYSSSTPIEAASQTILFFDRGRPT